MKGGIADRPHMIAALDVKKLGARDQGCKLGAGAGDHVVATDGDERRHLDGGELFRGDLFARTPHAGGKRLQIASGLLGEGPEAPRRVVGHVLDARSFERPGDRAAAHHAPHHVDAEPADDKAAHTLRVGEREEGGDPRAHRIAHHIGPRDAEMIEQPPPVLCHRRRTVRVGIVEFVAPSMPPIVISDHPAPRGDECSHPTRVDPIGDQVRGKAVDQQDGLALPLVEIGDLDAV